MTNKKIIIHRKKAKHIFFLIIGVIGFFMFLYAAVITLLTPENYDLLSRLFSILIVVICSLGLYSARTPITKILSSNPELIITKSNLKIFDNPKYDEIPLNEIKDIGFHFANYSWLMSLTLKKKSDLAGNISKRQRFVYGLSKKKEIIMLNIDFADINLDDLEALIRERI